MTGEPIRDDQILVRYLLGSLPEDQTERVDELSMADDDFAWRLRAAENELVDAYVRNELSGETLDRFRSFYLTSPLRREKVKFAETLLGLSVHGSQSSGGWFAASFTIPRWSLAASLAAGLLIAGFLVYDNAQLRRQIDQAQLEAGAAASGRHAAAPAPSQVAMVLRPPLRGGGPIPELAVPQGADRAVFALKLEGEDFPAYEVALKDTSGSPSLWRSEELKSANGVVSVSAPASLLRAGDYVLQLSPGPNSEPLANYVFRVVTP